MAYTEPVLVKRIDPDPAKRTTAWYEQYVATGATRSCAGRST
jgi:hypothetical protein